MLSITHLLGSAVPVACCCPLWFRTPFLGQCDTPGMCIGLVHKAVVCVQMCLSTAMSLVTVFESTIDNINNHALQ